MVSLSGPGKGIARPKQITGQFLPLEFNDISQKQIGLIEPAEQHIDAILTFGEKWQASDGNLLLHCWMGISRSTATALLLAARANPKADMDILATGLRKLSPTATPNMLMIEIGDRLIGCGGRLVKAVEKIGRGAEASEGVPFRMEWVCP